MNYDYDHKDARRAYMEKQHGKLLSQRGGRLIEIEYQTHIPWERTHDNRLARALRKANTDMQHGGSTIDSRLRSKKYAYATAVVFWREKTWKTGSHGIRRARLNKRKWGKQRREFYSEMIRNHGY